MTVSNRTMLMLAATVLGAMSGGPAGAQAPRPATPQVVPEEQQSQRNSQDEPTDPQPGIPSAPSGSLSNELSRSGGVVRPPTTGDQGVVAPPSAGAQSTPVIPPPGTPGGNQEIQPK